MRTYPCFGMYNSAKFYIPDFFDKKDKTTPVSLILEGLLGYIM